MTRAATLPATAIHPTPDIKRMEAQLQWLNDHYRELLAIYSEKFIAVMDAEVIAVEDHLESLHDRLVELGLWPHPDVHFEFITRTWANSNF